jgi:hypothetical protein
MTHDEIARLEKPMTDNVNHPAHYTAGSMEVIDAIEGLQLDGDFCLGNVLKYIARSKHKGCELQDLRKAEWYLKRKISLLERTEVNAKDTKNISRRRNAAGSQRAR